MGQMREDKARRRRNAKLAVLLQCIPMIGAASCIANGVSNQQLEAAPLVLWWFVCFWGIGYFYLGRWRRGLVALLAGPALAFGSCIASFNGVNADYEHCGGCPGTPDADRAAIETGLVVAAAVLAMAVDAWRLAKQQNLDIEALERGEPDDGPPR